MGASDPEVAVVVPPATPHVTWHEDGDGNFWGIVEYPRFHFGLSQPAPNVKTTIKLHSR